jgi:hypothetical protein
MSRGRAKCYRMHAGTHCRRARDEHEGVLLLCPGGSGKAFQPKKRSTVPSRKVLSASNSFNLEQARALAFVLEGVRSGRDLRAFQRANARVLVAIERKALRMVSTIHRLEVEAEQPPQQSNTDDHQETAHG